MNKHLKHVVYLSIWSFTVVVVWIGLSLFFQSERSQVSDEILQEADHIPPTFDRQALQDLGRRRSVEIDLTEVVEFGESTPQATESGELEDASLSP